MSNELLMLINGILSGAFLMLSVHEAEEGMGVEAIASVLFAITVIGFSIWIIAKGLA